MQNLRNELLLLQGKSSTTLFGMIKAKDEFKKQITEIIEMCRSQLANTGRMAEIETQLQGKPSAITQAANAQAMKDFEAYMDIYSVFKKVTK